MTAPRLTEDEARRRVEDAGKRKGFEIARWDGYRNARKPFGVLRCLADGCGHQWGPAYGNAVRKRGCPKCGVAKGADAKRITEEEARLRVEEAGRRKGFEIARWDGYQGVHKSFGVIRCLRSGCGHEWSPVYGKTVGNSGCPACAASRSADAHRRTEDEARSKVEDAGKLKGFEIARWGGYRGAKETFGVLRCLADGCGHEWRPRYSLAVGRSGCPKCGVDAKRITEEEARRRVEDAGKRKGFEIARWDGYRNARKPFGVLRCLADGCGHQWGPIYESAVGNNGCPACAKGGFDPSKPGWLYYDRIDASSGLGFGAVLFKIGITNRTPDDRYKGRDRRLVTPLRRVRYENGADARGEERRILREFAADRYEGPDVLQSGNTELFTRDVLGLDVADVALAA